MNERSRRAAAADEWSATRRAMLMGGAVGAGAIGASLINPAVSGAVDPPLDDHYVWRSRVPANVKDTGASGVPGQNTPAVETAAIKSAIAGAGVVYFPPGTYVINDTLLLPAGTMLYGPGATIKADSSMSGTLALIQNSDFSAGQADIALVGLEIDCNKTGRQGSTTQIEFRGNATGTRSKRIAIRECYIHDASGPTIAFQNVEKLRIHDNVITNGDRDGILCQANCREVAIYGNEISGCNDDHVGVHSGPQSTNQSMDVAITGNVVNAVGATNGNGIAVNGILRASVSDNSIYGGFLGGILITNHDTFPCQEVTVHGNVVVEPGLGTTTSEGDGIHVGVYSGYYGQNGEAPVKDILFAANTILRPRRHGVLMEGRSSASGLSRVTFADNHLSGGYGPSWTGVTTGSGLYTADANVAEVALRGNRVCDFTGRGLRIDFAVQRIDVTGNSFLNNGRGGTVVEGVYLGPASDVLVVGNRITDTQAQANKTQVYGVNVGTASGVWCVGNDLFGNKTAAIIGTRASGHGYEFNRGDDTKYLDMAAGTGQTIDVKGPVMFVNSPPSAGSATITSITPGYPGQRTTLIFTGSNVTVKDGTGTLRLNADLPSAPDKTLTLVTDGINWFEVGRSTNN